MQCLTVGVYIYSDLNNYTVLYTYIDRGINYRDRARKFCNFAEY